MEPLLNVTIHVLHTFGCLAYGLLEPRAATADAEGLDVDGVAAAGDAEGLDVDGVAEAGVGVG